MKLILQSQLVYENNTVKLLSCGYTHYYSNTLNLFGDLLYHLTNVQYDTSSSLPILSFTVVVFVHFTAPVRTYLSSRKVL